MNSYYTVAVVAHVESGTSRDFVLLYPSGFTIGPSYVSIMGGGGSGTTGPQGPSGDTGPQGPSGNTGTTGLTGPSGTTGSIGSQGIAGPSGATGSVGPAVSIASCWPIGSVFISIISTNPATLLGIGTWVQFGAGRMLVSLDTQQPEFASSEQTGGSKTTTPTGTVSIPSFTGSLVTSTGTTAGTPTGTVSIPTFTGAELSAHSHELPFTKAAGGTATLRMLASSVFGTGASRAPESQSAAPTAFATAAAVLRSQSITAGTPAGTVSQPTFTGNPLSTHTHNVTAAGTISQPSFTGDVLTVLPPYISVYMHKRTA